MSAWTNLLPITAAVAIGVFIAREVLEFLRRRAADVRKVRALKALLARECELNLWTIKSLRSIFSEVHSSERPKPGNRVTIEKTASGQPYARVFSALEEAESHQRIPSAHRELMTKFLLEIATVDRRLFEVMEPAYDSIGELEHVRESLVNVSDAPEDIGEDGYLEGLASYGLRRLTETEAALGALYRHCTGAELTTHRLR